MIRLFAALAIPDDIAAGLAACQQGVRSARWSVRENLHLTLRFFGETPPETADDLDARLAAIRAAPFEIGLQGVGAFAAEPGRGALFASARSNPALERLAAKCETSARRAGLKPDPRTYRPHVTLAYLSGDPGPAEGAWIAQHNLLRTPDWTVDRFFLYSSRLGPKGSTYTVEREYLLR